MSQSPLLALPASALLLLLTAGAASPVQTGGAGVTLETIMADPDWIGNAPERPYWSDDGSAIYYEAKRRGSELRDLYRVKVGDAATQVVADSERGGLDAPRGEVSSDRKWKLYVRNGDIFVKNLASGAVRQITRTAEPKSRAQFMADGKRVSFLSRDTVFTYDLESGLLSQPADLRLTKDPHNEDAPDFLKRQQLRLFTAVREEHDRKKEGRDREETLQRSDASRPALPWYLGEKVKIKDLSLSPSGEWLLVVTGPKDAKEPKKAVLPHWVTETGYIEPKDARPLVGTEGACGDSLFLLDLRGHQRHDLDVSLLPGIKEDPLKALRDAATAQAKARAAAAAKSARGPIGLDAGPTGKLESKPVSLAEKDAQTDAAKANEGTKQETKQGSMGQHDARQDANAAKAEGEHSEKGEKSEKTEHSCGGGPGTPGGPPPSPTVRSLTVLDAVWTRDGRQAAVEMVANDHKDRWIATLDLNSGALVPRHRLTDKAWINWSDNGIGWLNDNTTLYFDSEESGWNHLYTLDARDGKIHQLTNGKFEVSQVQPSFDGRTVYYAANVGQPGQYDIWRVAATGGKPEQLTHLGGLTAFTPSLDETQLMLVHSSIAHHDEIYVQANQPAAQARQLTNTVSSAFLNTPWTMPDIVPIPSSHGAGSIYSRVYTPPADAGPATHRPAVVFVHGAGYLQDAHAGWSYYFHEFMFATFLTQHGYVVLDMDYRASAGYGRDWRTAIYRQMGHPELEDLADGVDWLVRNKGVDRGRIGVYGGSYGGFLTLMALFRAPDLFAAGAALRPVTDWSDYNDSYTGAILNTPEIDPEAYDTSSPIEFAAGLKKPLLICHGMVDDNVFFEDSVRLVQRLIELEKQDFSIAPFPVESHSFHRASSWLDEYRRIWKLMSVNLR